jgi:hypothetical protein
MPYIWFSKELRAAKSLSLTARVVSASFGS